MRVAILLVLIGFSLYIYALVRQEEVESPYEPTPLPTRSALSYITEAEQYYMQGLLTEAIAAYEQAIVLEPENEALRIPLVRLLVLSGDTPEAIQRGEALIETEAADNSQAWAVLGMAYDWNGDVEEAVEACLRSVELDPTNAEAYACLAEAYADARQWAEATEAAQMAIELDDRSVDAHRNYGYVMEVQGNWTRAIEQYEKALAIHPNLAHIHISVGQNYRALGNIDQAIESFKRALEIQPDSARTSFELGWTYLIYLGEYEQAESHLTRATELNPEFGRAFGALAITYWAERHYEAAIPAFEKAIALETTDTRRDAEQFLLTVEESEAELTLPSLEVVLEGDFAPADRERQRQFQATLEPASATEPAGSSGIVKLDAVSGDYTIEASDLPRLAEGETYVGWFVGVATLSGPLLNTGPLRVSIDGTISSEDNTGYVAGPSIEYFYTLGLAYYYKEDCERAIPLFLAALEIDPEEQNALEGLSYCRE